MGFEVGCHDCVPALKTLHRPGATDWWGSKFSLRIVVWAQQMQFFLCSGFPVWIGSLCPVWGGSDRKTGEQTGEQNATRFGGV